MEPFYKNKWFGFFLFVLAGLLILYMLILVRPIIVWGYRLISTILAPFIIALIISYVLNPIVTLLNQRKVPRTVAVLLIYAVFITSLSVIMLNLIPVFVTQLAELNEHIPQMTMQAESLMITLNDHPLLPDSIREGIYNSIERWEKGISTAISDYIDRIGSTINTLFIAFIVPFIAFYILKDFKLIERGVITIVPKSYRKPTVKLLRDIDQALGNYIRGQFIVCVIVGLLAYIGYWLIDMPYPLLMASLVSIFNIIPYLGPFFGAAPAIIMAATVSWKMVLYVIIVNTLVQILEGNVVSPQVVGRTLHMHPLTIIFALLVGGELAGIIGLILAVPFFAVMKVIVQHIFIYYVHRKPTG
ncbi:pheromone autoinducer 2 transporter [Chlamydia abortus]|uniref:AI-2E family transporter n=1 Tax=Paenibacillus residui TaxID=629724 RepID=A0ABW3DF13_9BACL|nr:AI-2E family transporter [Paenibacillus sp. 32O-W]SHE09759.1 pheromone autoinducer 2 transporter [Chlamydia abortus]